MTGSEPVGDASRPSWLTFAPIGAAMVLTALNFSISFVAFGEIAETFNAEGTTVSWTLTAFSITIGALTVPGGWAADRYGRARVFAVLPSSWPGLDSWQRHRASRPSSPPGSYRRVVSRSRVRQCSP